jgi:hypothetical protein
MSKRFKPQELLTVVASDRKGDNARYRPRVSPRAAAGSGWSVVVRKLNPSRTPNPVADRESGWHVTIIVGAGKRVCI